MAQVVFTGDRQVGALARLYYAFAGEARGQTVIYLPSGRVGGEADALALERADIVVAQVGDETPPAGGARQFRVPLASAEFLWPFAGLAHPRNRALPFLTEGPYPAELGDGFLDRLIGRGVTADAALAAYLAPDLAGLSPAELDRRHQAWLDRQRQRDDGTGIAIAGLVEAHFRGEAVFLTPHHPGMRVFSALMDGLFSQMGVDRAAVERMHASLLHAPFPREALPIHPAVATHFGMQWATPATRYRFLHEGGFTFEEYCRRYVGFTWNAALTEGIALSHADELERSGQKLVEGLAASPESVDGWRALSRVLERLGRPQEALAAAERALAIDPEDRDGLLQLGQLHMRAGRVDEAGPPLRRAAAMRPRSTHALAANSEWLAARGRRDEAVGELLAARALDPVNPHIEVALGRAWTRCGDTDHAIACFRRAVALAPEQASFRELLAHALVHAGGGKEAIGHLQAVAAELPGDGTTHALLGSLLLAEGEFAAAAEALRQALARDPRKPWVRRELAQALEGLGRDAESLAEIGIALRLAPQDPHLWAALGHTHAHRNRLAEAEACFRRSAALDPDTAAFRDLVELVIAQSRKLAEQEAATLG